MLLQPRGGTINILWWLYATQHYITLLFLNMNIFKYQAAQIRKVPCTHTRLKLTHGHWKASSGYGMPRHVCLSSKFNVSHGQNAFLFLSLDLMKKSLVHFEVVKTQSRVDQRSIQVAN